MQSSPNMYKLLETGKYNTALEIRQSYKRVSRKYHPDKNPSSDAEVMFQKVKSAYDVSVF
jgi:DnaJ family protein B protein 4